MYSALGGAALSAVVDSDVLEDHIALPNIALHSVVESCR